jgi:hypothetical protein
MGVGRRGRQVCSPGGLAVLDDHDGCIPAQHLATYGWLALACVRHGDPRFLHRRQPHATSLSRCAAGTTHFRGVRGHVTQTTTAAGLQCRGQEQEGAPPPTLALAAAVHGQPACSFPVWCCSPLPPWWSALSPSGAAAVTCYTSVVVPAISPVRHVRQCRHVDSHVGIHSAFHSHGTLASHGHEQQTPLPPQLGNHTRAGSGR